MKSLLGNFVNNGPLFTTHVRPTYIQESRQRTIIGICTHYRVCSLYIKCYLSVESLFIPAPLQRRQVATLLFFIFYFSVSATHYRMCSLYIECFLSVEFVLFI